MTNSDLLIEKARHFMSISRYEEAVKLLIQSLASEPDNYEANMLLSASLFDTNKYHEAFQYSRRLIELAPDYAPSHYYHALNFTGIQDLSNAEKHLRQAIELDPEDADYWGVLSWIFIQRNQWAKALEYAEQGLAVSPENIQCLNHKSTCLVKLGKVGELNANLEETLARDPGNYYSHATAGWSYLEKGDYKKAKEHFLESLRINPRNEHARNGVIQALKARNWFFRMFLGYYFWIGKFQQQAQWGIIIGVYIANRFLRNMAKTYPALLPVVILLGVMMYLTWIINPLFNLFLRLDPLGKHALNEEEKISANFVGGGLFLALVSLVFYILLRTDPWFFTMLYFASVIIPITSYYELPAYKSRQYVGWAAVGLSCLGAVGIAMVWVGASPLVALVYLMGVGAFGWIANYLAMKTS
jgi:tetratricopeptide (TPR) repeat protein